MVHLGHQTGLLHLLVRLIRIVGEWVDGDTASGREDTYYLQIPWFHQFHQILHDDVDAILMEIAVVAEAEKVELQRFALHHSFAWNVVDDDFRKIRLTGLRTEAGELRTIQGYKVIVLRMLVDERLQDLWRVVGWVNRLFVA